VGEMCGSAVVREHLQNVRRVRVQKRSHCIRIDNLTLVLHCDIRVLGGVFLAPVWREWSRSGAFVGGVLIGSLEFLGGRIHRSGSRHSRRIGRERRVGDSLRSISRSIACDHSCHDG
jgi:hypothetical protein